MMTITYDESTEVLSIMPTATSKSRTFRDLGFIKFLDKGTDPNVCDSTGFSYSAVKNDKSSTDTSYIYDVTPKNPGSSGEVKDLIAKFTILDDDGTINFNLTTKEDFAADNMDIFRAWHVQNYGISFNESMVTKKLSDHLEVTLDPFSFKLMDNQKNVLYTSDPAKLYLTEFLVFDSGNFATNQLNDNPLMGMGERAGDLFFNNEVDGVHSRWNTDGANPIDDGLPPGRNMYGFQPFYQYQTAQKGWVGVFNNNPYATDFIVTNNHTGSAKVTTVTIGGAIEKYFFFGGKVDDLIIKYEHLTGMPIMPPMWSFGWQQCRYGWVTDQIWQEVVDNYTAAALPIDTMWADIDYMEDYKIFTISQSRYANISKQVDAIRARNMTFVPIMDAAVGVRLNESYPPLDTGISQKIFIKQSGSDDPLTAGVFAGNSYFPDFYNP